jgi:hypothetical protein
MNRRAFLGTSIAALATLGHQTTARAAPQCARVAPPARLTVDCSAGRNLQLFLKNASLFGLTGVVSMTTVASVLGTYPAMTLFLYPWLKSKNQGKALAEEMRKYQAYLPGPIPANPLPNMGVPLDEQFCRYGLQAQPKSFIGFSIDVPRSAQDPKLSWYSIVDQVGGSTVGVGWSSDNLNDPWFGGNHAIPRGEECNGGPWRRAIVDGVRRAATMAC